MKAAENLSFEALVDVVTTLQARLYRRSQFLGEGDEVFDPDNEWNGADICEALAGKLSEHGLIPEFLGDLPDGPIGGQAKRLRALRERTEPE